MTHIPTDDKQFVRDRQSQALLNTDKIAFQNYKRARSQLQTQAEFEKRIDKIENAVSEIHTMLQQLCNQR